MEHFLLGEPHAMWTQLLADATFKQNEAENCTASSLIMSKVEDHQQKKKKRNKSFRVFFYLNIEILWQVGWRGLFTSLVQ